MEPPCSSFHPKNGLHVGLPLIHPEFCNWLYDSDFLADHIVHYLNQSVQIRADVILHGDLALMIEAMPGSDEGHWFRAVETMAAIPAAALKEEPAAALLRHFDSLRCQQVGVDEYAYRCGCSPEKMRHAVEAVPTDQLAELVDEHGNITLSCQYCNRHYEIKVEP